MLDTFHDWVDNLTDSDILLIVPEIFDNIQINFLDIRKTLKKNKSVYKYYLYNIVIGD